ncbi:MAG: TMEM165/GDT1 family protein [Mycobacterium leprae]
MHAFLTAFAMVVLAEMGDKTQLLAMAFAAKYRAGQVMAGVLIATIFNHALAVLVGTYLGQLVPLKAVSIAAGLSFLVFGLWTIQGDTLGDEANKRSRFGPVITVTIAFFLAEMGDKTQLATVALAADYRSPLYVLLGTTAGMLVADGLAVLLGDWIARKVSQKLMKGVAAGIFILFGFITFYEAMGSGALTWGLLGVLLVITAGIAWWLVRAGQIRQAALGEAAATADRSCD